MPAKSSQGAMVSATANLDPTVIQAIDAFAREAGHSSRSRLIEEALHHWIPEQRRRDLERQVEEYYLSLSEAEREEDREWAEGVSRAAIALWE